MYQLIKNIRRVFQARLYSFASVIGLALGIASFLVVFNWVYSEYDTDRGFVRTRKVCRLESEGWVCMPTTFRKALDRFPGIRNYVMIETLHNPVISIEGEVITSEDWIFADKAFTKMFNLDFIAGDPQQCFERPDNLILTESESMRLFGSVNVVGQSVMLDKDYLFYVSAVIKDPDSHIRIKAIAPFESAGKLKNQPGFMDQDSWNMLTYLDLNYFVDRKALEKDLNLSLNELINGEDRDFFLRDFKDIYFASDTNMDYGVRHGNKTMVILLSLVSLLVLVISCFNIAILIISSSLKRTKDICLKKIFGAERRRIIISFLPEVVTFVSIALFLAVIILSLLSPVIESITNIPLSFRTVGGSWLMVLGLTLVFTVIVSGLLPAFFLSGKKPILLLSGDRSEDGKPGLIQRSLIVFQLVISLILTASAISIEQQVNYLQKQDLGFSSSGVISVHLHSDLGDDNRKLLLRERLLNNSNIVGVTLTNEMPGILSNTNTWRVKGEEKPISIMETDPDFITTMGLNIISGRNLDWGRESDKYNKFILNETAARYLGYYEDNKLAPRTNYGKSEIIGVVKDFHFKSLNEAIEPLAICWSYDWTDIVHIRASDKNIAGALAYASKVWKEIYPADPFNYQMLSESLSDLYAEDSKIASVLSGFIILAFIISGVGLIAFSSAVANRRKKEIGIRKVNGAKVADILMLLNKSFFSLLLLSLIISIPVIIYIMQRWNSTMAYKPSHAWWVVPLSFLLVAIFSLLTISYHSWKAGRSNPVEVIRDI